jgi:fatty acid desaturase
MTPRRGDPNEPGRHPHDFVGTVPERLDPHAVRELSRIDRPRVVVAIATEWAIIAATIALALNVSAWPVQLLAIVLIGARQHAITVIAHDASHFRLWPGRTLNDWIGNLFLAWPMFISVQGFRHYHGDHHRFLQGDQDGNRQLWHTHDAAGRLTWEWTYPKTPAEFVLVLVRRVVMGTGVFWLLRGIVGVFLFGDSAVDQVARVGFWLSVTWILTVIGGWSAFAWYWVVPYCTWHIVAQYMRLICEHSAVRSEEPAYAQTRSTIPGWLGRCFVLPRNIGYHLEHHWYPSVPFYRLPELHARLAALPGFRAHACCSRSLLESLRQCTTHDASGEFCARSS